MFWRILPLILATAACGPAIGDPDAAMCPIDLEPEQISAFWEAMEEWNEKSEGRVTLHPGCGGGAVEVRGIRGLMTDKYGEWQRANGVTDVYSSIIKLEVERTPEQFRRTALHEIGHWLTGDEHSDNEHTVMYKTNKQDHLTALDIARLE